MLTYVIEELVHGNYVVWLYRNGEWHGALWSFAFSYWSANMDDFIRANFHPEDYEQAALTIPVLTDELKERGLLTH